MPKKKYLVDLSPDEREQLQLLIRRGTDEAIVAALDVGIATVERTRKRFVESGLESLNERPRPGKRPKLDGKAQARLIAEACAQAPEGHQRWTLQLLAERVVELKLADSCSYELVRRTLKKTSSSLG
jgi:transposase